MVEPLFGKIIAELLLLDREHHLGNLTNGYECCCGVSKFLPTNVCNCCRFQLNFAEVTVGIFRRLFFTANALIG